MVKVPREVAGFVALPVRLKSTLVFPQDVTHYIYLKPHDPKFPDEDTARSLFLVNIPILTTEVHLKHLFTTQLDGGRIETVHFAESAPGKSSTAAVAAAGSSGRKRKRVAEEIEAGLDSYTLPSVFDTEIHPSGAAAIVVFVDRPSLELSLRAARRAAKSGAQVLWGQGIEDKISPLGLTRYEHHKHLQYPSRKELLRCVDGYMTAYAQLEEARSRENARKRQMPDEDGFVTVTRGAKGGIRKEDANELAKKQKDSSQGLDDFYRFQMRERRKEHQIEMLKSFEEDKRKVQEMRRRRGNLKVRWLLEDDQLAD